MSKKIRDFIYLDTERVRSYLAQMEDGLQTDRGVTRSHGAGATGEFEVNALIAKGTGDGSYQYGYASSVNYQAHDEVFNKLLERLKDTARVKDAKTASPWNELTFLDGEFITTQCAVKIIDMEGLKTQLTVMPKLNENVQRIQNASVRKSPSQINQQNKLSKFDFGAMAKLLEETQLMLYGDSPVMVKLYPDVQQPEKYFDCSARNEFFREKPATIARQYGRFFDAGWQCLLLMNKRKVMHDDTFITTELNTSDIAGIAEYVRDLFEQHMSHVKQRNDIGNATLLALYREI